jgi:hypothetical protein
VIPSSLSCASRSTSSKTCDGHRLAGEETQLTRWPWRRRPQNNQKAGGCGAWLQKRPTRDNAFPSMSTNLTMTDFFGIPLSPLSTSHCLFIADSPMFFHVSQQVPLVGVDRALCDSSGAFSLPYFLFPSIKTAFMFTCPVVNKRSDYESFPRLFSPTMERKQTANHMV